jgi:rubrerythrin
MREDYFVKIGEELEAQASASANAEAEMRMRALAEEIEAAKKERQEEMKKFICRKCGWSGYEMATIKTNEEDNELPEEEWARGCPYCKTDKYITLEE